MNIDAAIRMGMGKINVSSKELSDSVSVSRSTVSRWCNAQTVPSQKMQKKLAEIFGVKYEEFIRWSEL